jgi:hypothetical protein
VGVEESGLSFAERLKLKKVEKQKLRKHHDAAKA